jgi:hypothetical protein
MILEEVTPNPPGFVLLKKAKSDRVNALSTCKLGSVIWIKLKVIL